MRQFNKVKLGEANLFPIFRFGPVLHYHFYFLLSYELNSYLHPFKTNRNSSKKIKMQKTASGGGHLHLGPHHPRHTHARLRLLRRDKGGANCFSGGRCCSHWAAAVRRVGSTDKKLKLRRLLMTHCGMRKAGFKFETKHVNSSLHHTVTANITETRMTCNKTKAHFHVLECFCVQVQSSKLGQFLCVQPAFLSLYHINKLLLTTPEFYFMNYGTQLS